MKLTELVDDYYLSFEYNNLREETKAKYKYFLNIMLDTSVGNDKRLGSYKLSSLTTRLAKLAYNMWCDRGVPFANHIMSVTRITVNHGINMEHCVQNVFSNVKRRTSPSRKIVWTRKNVFDFLDEAYSNYKTRSVGLIAHMAYEWCQRIGDMRLLQWSNIDFDNDQMHIEQSKRRAEVFLPIPTGLGEMLVKQKEDFGFQKYVAPQPKLYKGSYIPYCMYKLPRLARKVMNDAGLSNELRLSDLRRTGTVEMVDAGVSMGNIMSVTGHANPQSVKPYLKNTYKSANLACEMRRGLTDELNHDISISNADKERL
tara:strand:- start:633 stop:1571 length:939 start_codon:yes stop_codon:yes gene_type:complete